MENQLYFFMIFFLASFHGVSHLFCFEHFSSWGFIHCSFTMSSSDSNREDKDQHQGVEKVEEDGGKGKGEASRSFGHPNDETEAPPSPPSMMNKRSNFLLLFVPNILHTTLSNHNLLRITN